MLYNKDAGYAMIIINFEYLLDFGLCIGDDALVDLESPSGLEPNILLALSH